MAKTQRNTGGTSMRPRPRRGCSWRYHYPQCEFPYARLREENARRTANDREFELEDTGAFAADRYWQISVDYAKAAPRDVCMRIRVRNAGPDPAELHVLPTLWFRNRWAWETNIARPTIRSVQCAAGCAAALAEEPQIGTWRLDAGPGLTVVRRSCCSAKTIPTSCACSAAPRRRRTRRTASTITWSREGRP